MAKELYFHTKTSNTIEMTESTHKDLPKSIKVNYRLASESERELHENREGKKKVAKARDNKIKKANAKKDIEAENKKNKGTEATPKASSSESKA